MSFIVYPVLAMNSSCYLMALKQSYEAITISCLPPDLLMASKLAPVPVQSTF